MKRNSVLKVCFLLVVLWLIPAVSSAQSKYVVTGTNVNVRSSASTKGSVVGSLKRGETVTVKEIRNGWATISYKGQTRYVSASFLSAKDEPRQREEVRQPRQTTTNRQTTTTRQTTTAHQHSSSSRYSESTSSAGKYDRTPGFAMSSDLTMRYSNKLFTLGMGFDVGYQLNKVLYMGAGPMLEASMGDPGSSVAGGGYGKMRFVIPIENSFIRPMADLKGGYAYNFKAKSGSAFLYGGLGVNIIGKLNGGIGVLATTYKEVSQVPSSGSKMNGTFTPASVKEETKWDFTPMLFFSYDFCALGSSARSRSSHGSGSPFIRRVYPSLELGASYYTDNMGGGDDYYWIASQVIADLKAVVNFEHSDHFSSGVGIGADIDFSAVDVVMPVFLRGKYTIGSASAAVRPFVQLDLGARVKVKEGEDNIQGGFLFEPAVGFQYKKVYLTVGTTSYRNKYEGFSYRYAAGDEGTKAYTALNAMLGIEF